MPMRQGGNMTEFVPVSLVEGWINDIQSILKQESHEAATPTDLLINKGMRHGVDQIGYRLTTWLRHQENMETLIRSEKKFLITKDINLSGGRYRKLEWHEGNHFIPLAWRHGMHEETGELALELEDKKDLSNTFLVYGGSSSFDEMVKLARKGGLDCVKNEENRR